MMKMDDKNVKILIRIIAIIFILSGLFLVYGVMGFCAQGCGPDSLDFILWMFFILLLAFVIPGIGLLFLKNWARIMIIILSLLFLVFILINFVWGLISMSNSNLTDSMRMVGLNIPATAIPFFIISFLRVYIIPILICTFSLYFLLLNKSVKLFFQPRTQIPRHSKIFQR